MEALIYFAVWAALIFIMMRFGCGAHVMGHGRGLRGADDGVGPDRADNLRWVPPETDTDPVCGNTVRTDGAKPSVHGGLVYYFCSGECRERFESAPHLFVGPEVGGPPNQMDYAHG